MFTIVITYIYLCALINRLLTWYTRPYSMCMLVIHTLHMLIHIMNIYVLCCIMYSPWFFSVTCVVFYVPMIKCNAME